MSHIPLPPIDAAISRLHALVVDDDEVMVSLMAHMLRGLGVGSVATANGGNDGVAVYDRAFPKPDLVLCDLHMPETDGFQFMEQLSDRRFKGGILLVSGTPPTVGSPASLRERFHRLNVLGLLEKPVDRKSLAQALARIG